MSDVLESAGFFRHHTAIVETRAVGRGTRIWAFAHVLPGAVIGEDCNLCDHTFVENDVQIGNRVTIKCGVQLWDGVRLEDDAFVGPNATFTNDPTPRSKKRPASFAQTRVKRGASIGANATILPGITIGENALIGAGCVVTRDVPAFAIVVGNPGRIVGYDGAASAVPETVSKMPLESGVFATRVAGVAIIRMVKVQDLRGSLSFGENCRDVPFEVKRYFLVYGVPSKEIRGEHAHRRLHQFLVCVHGRCHVVADDGQVRQEFVLDDPSLGIHIPPMIWAIEYKYSQDAVLMVLASDRYDASDYIRNYSEFLELKRAGQ